MNKRQITRKAIIIVMFFFFPILITWLSPVIPVLYAMYYGIIPGAGIIFFLQFLFSLFFGRAFCGYVCPAAGQQECMMRISEKKIKSTKINIIKYIIWTPWIITIFVSFVIAGGVKGIDFFAATISNYQFLFAHYRYMIYFGVILLIAVLHLTVGKRAFCHCVCWMAPFMIIGTKISNLLKLPRLRLKANKDSCAGCNLCSKKCPMSLDVKAMVETDKTEDSECILCGECIDICPKKSITYVFKRQNSHLR